MTRSTWMVSPRWSLLAAVLLTPGCGTSESADCEDPCAGTAIMNVYVRDTANQPVARAEFNVLFFLQACGPNQRPSGWDVGVTNPQGHQRLLVTAAAPETMQCVVLTVNPSGNPAYSSGTKEFAAHLEFRAPNNGPRDSMRLEIVVP